MLVMYTSFFSSSSPQAFPTSVVTGMFMYVSVPSQTQGVQWYGSSPSQRNLFGQCIPRTAVLVPLAGASPLPGSP